MFDIRSYLQVLLVLSVQEEEQNLNTYFSFYRGYHLHELIIFQVSLFDCEVPRNLTFFLPLPCLRLPTTFSTADFITEVDTLQAFLVSILGKIIDEFAIKVAAMEPAGAKRSVAEIPMNPLHS